MWLFWESKDLDLLYCIIHCRMLEEFDREMEHTDSRMRSLTARVNKAIKKTGSKSVHV